ncbi:MAG: hypothetical protein AAFQ89_04570 [Cyanobacteria bacterium J06626_18]
MYQLSLPAGTSFSASTVGETAVDTALFLFDANGLGVIGNEDSAGTFQSTLPVQEISEAGTFYLGLSSFANRPVSAEGEIFPPFNPSDPSSFLDLQPTGPGAGLPLAGYTNSGLESGAYTIFLDALDARGLEVPEGETLALLGGDVRLEGGLIRSPGTDVQLGGVDGTGIVALDANQRASFPEGVGRADVLLENGAEINVRGDGGGSVAIFANNLNLVQGSRILGGIAEGATSGNLAGNISIDAIETVELLDGARISASTFGRGDAGTILINTATLRVQGESGASESNVSFSSSVSSQVVSGSVGDAGNVVINASDSVELLNGGVLVTNTFGRGDAGRIEVNTTTLRAQGETSTGFVSGVSNQVAAEDAVGNSEGIVVNASESISLLDGARLAASTFGRGDAGRIELNTNTLRVRGESSSGIVSGVVNAVGVTGVGNSRGIVINASDTIELLDGTTISADTFGQGDSGAIELNTAVLRAQGEDSAGIGSEVVSRVMGMGNSGGIVVNATDRLELLDGAILIATTDGQGDSGNIQINATNLRAQGEDSLGARSGIFSQVGPTGEGNSEGLVINVLDTIELLDGARLGADTFGRGDSGGIEITTATLRAQGENDVGIPSGITSGTATLNGEGDSDREGDSEGITIRASDTVELLDGAVIGASTTGQGNAGDIVVTVLGALTLQGQTTGGIGSAIISSVAGGDGQNSETVTAGNITLVASVLSLADAARISAETLGAGNAGSIAVESSEAVRLGQGTDLTAETSGPGAPGDIEVTTPTLAIGQDAELSTTITETSTNQEGGSDITLNTSILDISGELGIFAETNSAAPAGDLSIQPTGDDANLAIQFRDDGFISASTTAAGQGGSIALTAPETISISGQGTLSVETRDAGNAGTIALAAPEVRLSDGVVVSATTTGSGVAGDILFDVSDRLTIDGSTIESMTGVESTGLGGNIFIGDEIVNQDNSPEILQATDAVALRNAGQIAVDSAGQGRGGDVTLAANQLTLEESSSITADTISSYGGNLTFTLGDLLLLRNGSRLSAEAGTAEAGGNGGNITIDIADGFIVTVADEDSDIIANAFEGDGGSIDITAQTVFNLVERPAIPGNGTNDIDASSRAGGTDGSVNINNLGVIPTQAPPTLPGLPGADDIAEGCQAGPAQSAEFFNTGRGGIATNPGEPLEDDELWMDTRLPPELTAEASQDDQTIDSSTSPEQLVEATGWTTNEEGLIEFIALVPSERTVRICASREGG